MRRGSDSWLIYLELGRRSHCQLPWLRLKDSESTKKTWQASEEMNRSELGMASVVLAREDFWQADTQEVRLDSFTATDQWRCQASSAAGATCKRRPGHDYMCVSDWVVNIDSLP